MKKFIAGFDGLNFCESTMNYAIALARDCDAHLVGVFLEDITRHSYGMAEITNFDGTDFDRHMTKLEDKDQDIRDISIDIFKTACEKQNINYSIHRDRNVALQELLHETIYADLLFISAGETLTRFEEPAPTHFIKDLMNDVQCPVILVPPRFNEISKFVLLYDGEPSSVHAVRTFSYLVEPIKNIETEIVTVKGKEESPHLPDNKLIKEFIKRHFPKAEYVLIKGDPETEIIRYVERMKSSPLIVLGAYHRSRFSRLFKPSMADKLLQNVNVPLFIAHNKS